MPNMSTVAKAIAFMYKKIMYTIKSVYIKIRLNRL